MRHGSLFSGIGGFDLAAEWMGWENVFHCEWMEFPRKVLDYYWPNADSYTDITKTDFKKYANTIDILTGGFPCQPFSLAGKRKGTNDERYLWHEMLRAIQEIKPKFVIAENVFGITNIDGGMVFEQVCLDLEAEGYEVQPYVLPAAAVNAPHRRDRVWFVAYRNTSNTDSWGLERSIKVRRNSEYAIRENGIIAQKGDAADTESQSGEWMQSKQRELSQQEQREFGRTHSKIGNRNASDTECIRLEHGTDTGKVSGKETNAKREWNQSALSVKTNGNGYKSNWENFPTVSPICNGNDGLSDRLDSITFPKWRNESIKAGGNAIVPQVAYELFKQLI